MRPTLGDARKERRKEVDAQAVQSKDGVVCED